jgi:hypothetical protein
MKNNLEGSYKTLLIIWFALLASQVMFVGMIFMIKPRLFEFGSDVGLLGTASVPILGVFGMLAVTNIALSFIMKKRSYAQAVEKQEIRFVQTGLILACAFCEAVSLLGFVLAFAFDVPLFIIWSALGIIGTALHFPRREDVYAAGYKK